MLYAIHRYMIYSCRPPPLPDQAASCSGGRTVMERFHAADPSNFGFRKPRSTIPTVSLVVCGLLWGIWIVLVIGFVALKACHFCTEAPHRDLQQ